jgi:radical SAM protein with 4Fe4S-binding SPASM domain
VINSSWGMGPTHVDFNVTNGCNLACNHCHSSSGEKLPDELSIEEIKSVLDQLHRMGVLSLAIAGGEPFMRRDILDILEHACSLPGWTVSVITHGLFFRKQEGIEAIAGRCPGLTVNVSLDGSTPARFHVLRKQARRPNDDPTPMFTQVTTGITSLIAAGINTSVNITLSRPTIDDCIPTYRLVVDELGASALVGIKFFPGGYGKAMRDLLEIPYPVWSESLVRLTRAKLDGELPRMQISVPAPWEFYLPLAEAHIDIDAAEAAWNYRAPLREHGYRRMHSIGDSAGIAELSIGGDGNVYPSILTVGCDELICGNVREQSLTSLWRTSPALTAIRRSQVEDLSADCLNCPLVGVCGGGSRSRGFANSGSFYAADYQCPIVKPTRELADEDAQRVRLEPLMRTFGKGHNAVRAYATEYEAQLRTNGHIISCDGAEARAILAILQTSTGKSADEVLREDAAETHSVLTQLTDLLRQVGAAESAVRELSTFNNSVVPKGVL